METITLNQALSLYSADFGTEVRDCLADMEDLWDSAYDEVGYHPGEHDHGGPKPYIMHLAAVMKDMGWVGGPIEVCGDFLEDGHHRVLAAYMIDLAEIPMREVC